METITEIQSEARGGMFLVLYAVIALAGGAVGFGAGFLFGWFVK